MMMSKGISLKAADKILAVARASLLELFKGPTPEETARHKLVGSMPYPEEVIKSITIRDGVAVVDFAGEIVLGSGITASCGGQMFDTQLGKTLTQFPTIDAVEILIDGLDPGEF